MRRKFPATTPQRRHAYNHRLQGIAAALGELAGAHMEPELAAMVLDSLGLTIPDLQRAGADAYDLEHLHLATDEAPG
jgi:hypothetical protein